MKAKKDTSYSTKIAHLSVLEQYVGKEIGLTKWMTIEQGRIDKFAEVTEDFQWIHIDPKKSAVDSPFKKTVAHGFLILSMAPKFCYETVQLADVVLGVNYGLDKVRFIHAVPSGSNIRGRLSLLAFEEFSGGAKYTIQIVFELEGSEKPACIAAFIAMAYTTVA
ncbi:MAG: MaoC family dehydratase [Flavobacteriaceae bacterium]